MDDEDLFKKDFKYYKKRNPPPNLFNAIDFDVKGKEDSLICISDRFMKLKCGDDCCQCKKLGLRNHQTWELYSIRDVNGFIFIRNPFYNAGQKNWIRKCLQSYPKKPSITNLDLHHRNIDDIWSLQNDEDPVKRSYLQNLCWATLGYHHDWDTKVYNSTHYSEFPCCLKDLSQHVAFCVGYENYKPQAAIVNYYNLKSCLGIHNDHSEKDYNAPIISFSFGQSAIFLIGTQVKTEKPTAMFVRSGDIIIMSGACRLSYHAVPCIVQEIICDKYLDTKSDDTWLPFQRYLDRSRINVSVRQVYEN